MEARIADTLDYIEGNLDKQLTLEDLAEVACLSPSQFHRIFKKETGRTPFIFIEEMKMAKAYELISEGKVMIHELAYHLGYKDYETFTRAFKKHFYLSPDDLKSIANRIKEEMDGDEFILLTVEKDDEETIVRKLEETLAEKGIPLSLRNCMKAIKVQEKTPGSSRDQLIKNKFEMTPGFKIWESLIKSQK